MFLPTGDSHFLLIVYIDPASPIWQILGPVRNFLPNSSYNSESNSGTGKSGLDTDELAVEPNQETAQKILPEEPHRLKQDKAEI